MEKELDHQGFPKERIHLVRRLNMRFDGTDTALLSSSSGSDTDFEKEFKTAYQQEFGFLLQSRVMVDDINVGYLWLEWQPGVRLSSFEGQGRRQDI